MIERSSGILLSVSSLPSRYGIGTLGREAYSFIDFLCKAGQKYWQMLPLGPLSFGDSPYSPFSSFAGNPLYVDLEELIDDGLISAGDCRELEEECDGRPVDYQKQFLKRYDVLRKAYDNSCCRANAEGFASENDWVSDYALFMSLKYKNKQLPWHRWDYDAAAGKKEAVEKAQSELKDETDFWIFTQFLFYKQYFKLKNYAGKKGMRLIGDIPIYSAMDSADVWCQRNVFLIGDDLKPSLVAGVPPDAFSSKGQLWGNPVYNWDYLRENSFGWWMKKIEWSFKLYDAVRIDHFRGFEQFWAVPFQSEYAVNGSWMKAYGNELFESVGEKYGNLDIIAEDLGIITKGVEDLRNKFGFPGMKVLQFAFDNNPKNPYLPENYEENFVAYTGTHDNDTLRGWLSRMDNSEKTMVFEKLGIEGAAFRDEEDILYDIIGAVSKSKANLCIIPMQDYLCLGSQARMNTPSTLGDNWTWRMRKEMLTDLLAGKIREVAVTSGR
ncbi:MAG: 4-alpha-glucanotransferase [Sedimentibacter sp.]|uniref:4-alpha-glucanotransferase n=1 Tax=Sedimentibacter sp. TaxID=1960295 RepID=UPI00315839B4